MPSLPFWVFSFELWHFLTACLFYCLFFGHLWHFESACPFVFFFTINHFLSVWQFVFWAPLTFWVGPWPTSAPSPCLPKEWRWWRDCSGQKVLTTMHHFDKMNTCSHLDKINDWKLYVHFLQLAKKAKTKRFVPEGYFIINFPFLLLF